MPMRIGRSATKVPP